MKVFGADYLSESFRFHLGKLEGKNSSAAFLSELLVKTWDKVTY